LFGEAAGLARGPVADGAPLVVDVGSIVALNRSGGGLEVVVRLPLEAVEEEDSAGESKL
jgi:hypothetical protein